MFCQNCGNKIESEDYIFCDQCGTKVREEKALEDNNIKNIDESMDEVENAETLDENPEETDISKNNNWLDKYIQKG